MFLGATPKLFERAEQLRLRETKAEQLLWSKLRGKKLGVKFRRQHPIHSYIADFYCHSHKLIVEVDGPIHNTIRNRRYDAMRSEVFNEFNIDVIRFTNDQVLTNTELVVKEIRNSLSTRYPVSLKGAIAQDNIPH